MHVTARWGSTDTVRESTLKADYGRKSTRCYFVLVVVVVFFVVVCVCVCVCVRACVRACVSACVRACVRVCDYMPICL